MDQFLLKNVAVYQNLVKEFCPAPVLRTSETTAEAANMVVSVRIRPLTNEDVTAGFPSAVFPRSTGSAVVDIHDLYNHPRGRPILKVR